MYFKNTLKCPALIHPVHGKYVCVYVCDCVLMCLQHVLDSCGKRHPPLLEGLLRPEGWKTVKKEKGNF